MNPPIFRCLGMISGTSIDGIDTALLETDGYNYVRPLAFMPHSYEAGFRQRLRACFRIKEGNKNPAVAAFERELTELHAQLVKQFLQQQNLSADKIDLLGFHGQTIWHRPEEGVTIQLGDGALLARQTGIPVINDFRTADVQVGGHGAPLVPLYHRALASQLPKPFAVINIGGVSNITWINGDADEEILAFDMGPGNALLDDWVLRHTGQPFDQDGALALTGTINKVAVEQFMANSFFNSKPPKSLDRDAFTNVISEKLTAADGAATLTMMTVRGIVRGLRHLPQLPAKLYLTGGGRHNQAMKRWISELSKLPVAKVDELGWSGDGLEAEAFAYLAARSKLGLPLSLPLTTGVKKPMTGGRLHLPV